MLRAFHFRGRLKFCWRYGRQMPSRALNTHICLRTELSNTKHHGHVVKLCSSLFMKRYEEKIVQNKRMSPTSLLPYFCFNWLVILPRICFELYELSLMLIGDIFCNPSDDLGLHCLCLFAWQGRREAGPVIVIAGQSRRKQGRGGAVRAVCLRIASQPVRDNVIT